VSSPEPAIQVRAGGCIPWRPVAGLGGAIEVLVVHRPRYDDWSFPKGKCEPGEDEAHTAIRELHEETGLAGELGPELPATRYLDHRGRRKQVRYWSVRIAGGAFAPNDEVDEVRWLAVDEAAARLSYAHDRALLAHVVPAPA
jgi:8-oxo-dGTP diphosphatase